MSLTVVILDSQKKIVSSNPSKIDIDLSVFNSGIINGITTEDRDKKPKLDNMPDMVFNCSEDNFGNFATCINYNNIKMKQSCQT